MHVLNLGGGGFIGAHLTEKLLAEGHTVVAVDTHADKIREFLNHSLCTFIEQNILQDDFDLDALVQGADLVVDHKALLNLYNLSLGTLDARLPGEGQLSGVQNALYRYA